MKGRILYSCLFFWFFMAGLSTFSSAQTISNVTFTPGSVCPGSGVTVTFATSASFAAGNVFTAYLSDAAGTTYPTNIGTLTSRTGGNINATIPSGTANGSGYKIQVKATNGTSANSSATLTISLPPAPGVSAVSYCVGQTPNALTATGQNLLWYTSNSGGTGYSSITPSTSGLGSTTYYVSQTVNGCEGPRAGLVVTVNAIPAAPTATNPGPYCEGATASALTASGQNLKWYGTNANGGTPSGSATVPSTSASALYYVSQTVNACESARTAISVQVKDAPNAPTTTPAPDYCPNQTAAALGATATSGATLNWYGTNASGSATATPSVPGTTQSGTFTYYVSQTLNGCEGPKASINVTIKSTPPAPTVSPAAYCVGQPASALTATPSNGGSLTWYGTAASGGTASAAAPIPPTGSAGSTTYYVSQTVNGCEGPRAGLTVTVNAISAAPTATNPGPYCEGATASALTAAGQNLKWYGTDATGGSGSGSATVPSTAASAIGNTVYYVSQTVNGCESPRTAITVQVKTTPGAPATSAAPSYCQNQSAVALGATATSGATLNWYGTNASGSATATASVPGTTQAGTFTYYVSQTINGCEGPKASINVTIKPTPSAPGVGGTITACQNRSGSALSATPSNGGTLNWYGTASTGGTPSSVAPSVSTASLGTLTYYVSQSINGCEGPRASIAVTVNAVPSIPTANSSPVYCEGSSPQALSAVGQSLLWYGTNKTGGSGSGTATVPSTAASAIGTTDYYVTQTVNGCESERTSITVLVKDTPNAPGTTNVDFCQGTSAPALNIALVSNATPNWYGTNPSGGTSSSTIPVPSNATVGTTVYYVSQTLSGCEGPRASLSVRVKLTPTAPGVPTPSFCNNGPSQQLTASGTSLKWFDASDNLLGGAPTPNTGTVGNQTFKVSQTTNENCEGPKAIITVTIKPLPIAPGVSSVTLCQAQQDQPSQGIGTLKADGQGLKWFFPDGTLLSSAPIPSIDKAGTSSYFVTQTVNGCEGAKSELKVFVITPALPTVAKQLVTYCINDKAVPLEASGDTGSKLQWVDPFGRVLTEAPIPSTLNTNVQPGGDPFYVYQVASYGCVSARATIRVVVNTTPTLSLAAPTSNINLGVRAPIQLKFTGAGPYSYSLTEGYSGTARSDTTIQVLPRGNTTYQVATVTNGCGTGLPGNSVTITVRVPTVSTSSLTASTLCAGTSLTVPFTTTGEFNTGNTFRVEMISVADTTKKFAVPTTANSSPIISSLPLTLPSGQYYVRVKADNPEIAILGTNSPTVLTIRSLPTVTLTGTQNIYEGSPANLTFTFGGDGPWNLVYADSLRSYPITATTSPLVVEARPARTTTYRLTSVTNSCGTGALSGTAVITVLPLLGVDDNSLDPLVKAYPVPTETTLMVELNLPLTRDPAKLVLTDLHGQPVIEHTTRSQKNELNLSAQPSGVYLLRIQVGDRQTVRKVLKQ
jgi:hypothetical protein